MLFNLLKFLDFTTEIISENFVTRNGFEFTDHYEERTSKYDKKTRFQQNYEEGFELGSKFVDKDNQIIRGIELQKLNKRPKKPPQDYENHPLYDGDKRKFFDDLGSIELPRILSDLANSDKLRNYMDDLKINGMLDNTAWAMFLGSVCLTKPSRTDKEFYLDFKPYTKNSGTENPTLKAGSLWGVGDNNEAKTVKFFFNGENGSSDHDNFIREKIKNHYKYLGEGKKISLFYPYGKNFTVKINLDLEGKEEIRKDIENQIESSVPGEPSIPLVNRKKIEVNMKKILNNQNSTNQQNLQTMMQENSKNFETKKTNILSFSEFLAEKKIPNRGNNPCWPGYRQVGLKKKNGRSVPNCVPEKK